MRSPNKRILLAPLAAIAVFVAAYSNSLHNAFSFDDTHVVESNLFIRDLANLPRFFTDARTFSSLPQNATYRPLVSASLAIDYAIAHGLDPVVFHVTQLALIALLGALIAVLYRRLYARALDGREVAWVALAAATLYVVHTGNSQVGNYISARSESLSALGVLTAFLLYELAPRWRRFYLYLIPVVVGAMAKNHAVVFAPLLLTWKLLVEQQLSIGDVFSRRSWPAVRRALVETAPAFALSIALFLFVEGMSPPEQTYGGSNRIAYFGAETWMWVRYVRMYFLPGGLTADTDYTPFASLWDWRVLAGLALLGASLVAAAKASRSRLYRPVAFGILWFWIGIAPTSSIFPLAEVTNDHRPFLGFIGLNAAMVWLVFATVARRFPEPAALSRAARNGLVAAVVIVIGAHAVATWQRNKVWRTDETLWADVVAKSPRNGRGIMNYGLSQMSRGRFTEARDLFIRAGTLLPNYSFLEVNLGVVYSAMHDSVEAERHFLRSLSLEPGQPVAHRLYARFLLEQSRGPQAIEELKRTLALSPGETEARHMLLAIYAARAQTSDLHALVDETLRLTSNDPDALAYARGSAPFQPATDDYTGWFNLGFSFTRAERHLDAAPVYRVAIARDSTQADAWNNLGWTLGRLGFFDDATAPLMRAIQLKPDFPLARNNLAWVERERARR